MPGGLDVTVDFTMQGAAGLLVARLSGTLGLSAAVLVRTHLLKCLAEQPSALLVDLAGRTISNELALSVFHAVVRQAVRWPGTPVLLCAPQPATAVMLASAVHRRLPVFPSLDRARTLLDSSPSAHPSIAEDLHPTVGAVWLSRFVVF